MLLLSFSSQKAKGRFKGQRSISHLFRCFPGYQAFDPNLKTISGWLKLTFADWLENPLYRWWFTSENHWKINGFHGDVCSWDSVDFPVPGLYLWPLLLLCEHRRLLGLACWLQRGAASAGEPGHVPTRSFYEAQLFQESSRDYSAIDIILDNIFKIFNFYQ